MTDAKVAAATVAAATGVVASLAFRSSISCCTPLSAWPVALLITLIDAVG